MRCMVLCILILMLTGCAVDESVHRRDGKEYGVTRGLFRNRWWNYYERGLSYAEGQYYKEAISDFQMAIKQRRDDQWRSRTYGMHFVKYFPHRELGITYYALKRYPEAERELENSLITAESAKAKYFLNKTRKAILEETGDDKLPPSIKIYEPLDETITNEFSIALKGIIEDDYFVSSVSLNSHPFPMELASKKVILEKKLPLKRGVNNVEIIAFDLTNKVTKKAIKINVDREGPIIIIEDQKISGRRVVIDGFLSDGTGISSFFINSQKIPIAYEQSKNLTNDHEISGQEGEFHHEIDLSEGSEHIYLKAEDVAGNVTRGVVRVGSSHTGINTLPLMASLFPADGAFKQDRYAFTGGGLGKIIDNIVPEIHLEDLADFQTVYTDSLYLEGRVSDNSRIESLLINGESVIRRKGKEIFFNYLTALREGGNRFIIEASDIFGNRTERIIAVHRKIPKVRQLGSRMTISVLPLDNAGEQSIAGNAMYDILIAAFVSQNRFQLIEREKMEEVLRELKISQTEVVDPGTASKIGKIVVADAMLAGTIHEGENSVEVYTRLIDTETSHIMDVKDVFSEDRSLIGIKRLMEGLALKYKQSFPLLEGFVIKKDGKTLITDIGEDKSIKRDMRLILYREGEEIRHPVTDRVLGSEPVELGEARVEDVYREFSKATIRKGKPENIRARDRTITK